MSSTCWTRPVEKSKETLETEEEIKQSEGKQNVLLIVGCSVGGLVVVVLVTLVIVWRYRKCKQPLNPAFHVRYDFGLAPGMQTAKTCPNGFKKTKLKSGTKLVVPNVIDDVKVNKMVAQGRFGAFFLYKLEKDLFWYKLEAKLKSPFRNPLASESGVCRLVQKTDDAVSAFIGNMINCGYYSEGVYYMRVENLGPSVRELRKGVVLPGGEVAKIAYQMLPCMRALVVYGICHRNIKESAFYFKKDELAGNPKMIITDLGFAIRIGSARTDFYPIPELATTFIHEKKASAVQDAESLIFMLLSMMIERLPWAGIKKTEAMTEAKVKYLASDMEGTSLEGNKTAGYFLSMREVFMSDPKTENPAEHMFNQLTTLMNPSELCLPIAWPERDANTDESVADSSQKDSPKA